MSWKTYSFLILFLFSILVAGKPVVLDIWYDEFPPYFLNSSDPKYPGFAIELIRRNLPSDAFSLVWHKGSWSSTVPGLERGDSRKYPVIAMIHPADTGKVLVSQAPIFFAESGLFVLKSQKIRIPEGEFLPEGKGSVPKDWSISDEADAVLEKKIAMGLIRQYPVRQSAQKGCELLIAKKIRFLIDDPAAVNWALSRMKRKKGELRRLPLHGTANLFYVGFSRDNSNARKAKKAFDKNYQSFFRSEEYLLLRKKYGVPAVPASRK